MDKYEGRYLGFKINAERLPKAGDSVIWLFNINDENDQRIFRVRLKVSRNTLMASVSEEKDENEFILEEGLK